MDKYNSFGLISNRFIMDANILNESVSIFSIIRTMFYNINNQNSLMNIQTLYYFLSADSTVTSSVKPIKSSFEWLIENKYIAIKNILNLSDMDINYKSNIMYYVNFPRDIETTNYLNDGGFTKVSWYNLNKILNYLNNENISKKYAFIRYFLIMSRYCSNDSQFGVFSLKRVSQIISVSINTCVGWNKILEKLGIIYYDSTYGHITEKRKFVMDNTMYCQRNVKINNKLITKQHFNNCILQYVEENNLIKVK